MKKLVPDPPRPLRDPELDRANANLLSALKPTQVRPFGLRDAQGNTLSACKPGSALKRP